MRQEQIDNEIWEERIKAKRDFKKFMENQPLEYSWGMKGEDSIGYYKVVDGEVVEERKRGY